MKEGIFVYDNWNQLKQCVENCTKCDLCKDRKNVVLGDGNINAKLMFIGEGPGADEDEQGLPFVGKAGKLMNEAFKALGINRDEVYIANIVKCRPPKNRNPYDKEIQECLDYLRNQVMLVKPEVIVLLGSVALTSILGKEYSITSARGKLIEKKGIKYIPTFHPAALLRDDSKKIYFYLDLKKAKNIVD